MSINKTTKVISIIALGLALFLVLPPFIISKIEKSDSVQEKVATTFADGFAKNAYTNAAIAAIYREDEITEKDIQDALKEIVATTDTMKISFDKEGNLRVELDDGGVAYSCVNLGGFGSGKCGEAVLSKKFSVNK